MVDTARVTQKFRLEDDDYEVVTILGAGGMGTVYKARQKSLARFVAIKMLNAIASTDTESVARLKREATVAAQVVHPNIVKVHSIGFDTESNLPFIVMEYLEGESLAALLAKRGKLAESEAVAIITPVLDALTALHAAGLVHRDVKPHNIFVTTGGGIKLMDLGIVKSVNGEAQRLTQTGATLGSPAYMSPEQCSGATDLDGRSDLYSLGCTLFRVLSGQEPFRGETALEVMFQQLHQPMPPLNETVSPHIKATIAKAIEKSPDDRFATAQDFKQALLGNDATCTVPPKQVRKKTTVKTFSLSPRLVACGLAVSTMLVAGGWYVWSHPQQSKVSSLPPFVKRLYFSQDGRCPHEVLKRVRAEMVEDQTFWQLTPDARKAAMKPVLDYAERQIKDRNSHHDWDELFPLTIAYADMIACYDKGQAYELIKQVLSADRALDTDINNGAQWSRLSCNYVAALECLQNRGYRKEFEDLFAEFMALSPDGGESDFRNKNIAWAHIAACDYYAGLKDFGKAESMARKALALRSDAELTGTIEQVRTYTKLCEQLHAQKKWKELLKEVNDGCGVSLYVMDAANDRYNTRQCRLKMARMAIDACKALGDQKQLDRYQRLEREEEQGTDIHRKINV